MPPQEPAPSLERRRPGRFRRLVLRPVFWGLALLAVVIFLVQIFLDTAPARRWLADQAATRLGIFLDRPVEIADLSLGLVPLSVEVWGLVIGARPGAMDDEPFLEIPWLGIVADLNALGDSVLRLEEIRLERPRIYMRIFEDGSDNIPGGIDGPAGIDGEAGRRRFDLHIERLELDQAEVVLDQDEIRLSLDSDRVRARFEGLGGARLTGEVAAQAVELRLPGARPIVASVAGRAHFEPGRVELEQVESSGPHFRGGTEGFCSWPVGEAGERKRCRFEIAGTATGDFLRELDYFDSLDGEFEVRGTLDWRPGSTGWRSRLRAPALELWERSFKEVDAVVLADRHRVRTTLEKALYAGGELSGTIDLAVREEGLPFTVDLDFKGVAVDALLADQEIPAGPVAARVSGHVLYAFPLEDGEHGEGWGEVSMHADTARPGLRLAGDFPLRIDNGAVRVDGASLQSSRQSLFAEGFYDIPSRRGRFEYEIASQDVVPLIETLQLVPDGEPWPTWLPNAGQGEIEGLLHIDHREIATEVQLRLDKVRGPGLPDSFHTLGGGFRVDGERLDPLSLELGDGRAALLISGQVPLGERAVAEPTRLTFDGYAVDVEAVRPWIDFELPLRGRVSGRLDLELGVAGSRGRLVGTVAAARLSEVAFDEVGGELTWNSENLVFKDLTLRAPAGEMSGSGRLVWSEASPAVDLDLWASALELGAEPLSHFAPRPDLGGRVGLEAHVGGTLQDPDLDLRMSFAELALGERRLQGRSSSLAVGWSGGRFEASGSLLDLVELEGGGRAGPGGTDLDFAVLGNDLAGLLELLVEDPPGDLGGRFAGRLRIAGGDSELLGEPLRTELELERLRIDYRDRELSNVEPVLLRLEPERIGVKSFHLVDEASASFLSLTGSLGYEPWQPVDFNLESELSSAWLETWLEGVRLGGRLELVGQLGGTLDEPSFEGQGRVREGELVISAWPGFPHEVDNLEGVIQFRPDAVVIDGLTGELAGGRVRLEGRSNLPWAGEALDYRLRLWGEDLRLRYPEGWLLAGSAELTLRSLESGENGAAGPASHGHLLTGRAELTAAEYTADLSLGFAQVVRGAVERRRLEVEQAGEFPSATQVNLSVEAPRSVRIRNNLSDLSGSAGLVVRGTLAEPVLYGTVDLEAGGEIVYSGVDYEIERGRLSFTNPYRFDPEVDLVASTRVRDFDVTLTLSGTLERLDTSFSSEPPLPALEVFQLLATGGNEELEANPLRRADELGEEQSTSAASFLYGQAASVVGERVSNLFGFDKFRIEPLTGSGDNLSKARVTVGKRLSKDLFVSYSADPASTEEQRLQIEWQVDRGLVLVLTQNGDNTYEADVRWEKSF